MEILGLLKIQVLRGINLAVKDTFSSDPYVVIDKGGQRVKTSVKKNSCNPVWNEELTVALQDPNIPIVLSVYDKDTFTGDDKMGVAEIDINPYLKVLKRGLQDLPNGVKVDRVQPSKDNCLASESCIVWENGKMIQDMILRLRDVECGEVEVQIEMIPKCLPK
ncbi:protein C2-DOMAIN ABA-RELATED 7-like isoform X1 [Lycium barbarum]|uniref:protein C2-DOMAIN ABA-RELATED 7-like isoform X1 n=1 Tax=Lycium barbarum TaxID=112863 RepID=UPI00293EE06D|nr:protein C2-DOMAIN ABA-RELATED 7-like isoform X1 [Lycium barbarum]